MSARTNTLAETPAVLHGHTRSDVHASTTLPETVGHDLHALGIPIFFVLTDLVQPEKPRKRSVRGFSFATNSVRHAAVALTFEI